MTRTDDLFIDLIADEGMELWNGETATNRISAPKGTDVSMWVERIIVIEEVVDPNTFDIPHTEI